MDPGALTGAPGDAPVAVSLRGEIAQDVARIDAVIRAAFGGEAEVRLVAALRRNGELAVSLVAESARNLVGHVAFSTAAVVGSEAKLAWLAPLAVLPSHHGQGVGSALVGEGLRACAAHGFTHAVVLGDPGYYGRFGFSHIAARRLSSRWQGGAFQAMPLGDCRSVIAGDLIEPAAFAILVQAHESAACRATS